jgi:putative flippase GtrA
VYPWYPGRMPTAFLLRGLRFSVVGALCTGIAYLVFIGLVGIHAHFLLANVAAWVASVWVGFLLNRYVTFGLRERDGMRLQFGLYLIGALSQLAVSSLGLWVLMGLLHLGPNLAFALNLVLTAGLMFVYVNAVVFRR